MKDNQETLEFNRIKERIQAYCVCRTSKEIIARLKPFTDLTLLHQAQEDLDRMVQMLYSYGKLPLSYFEDNTKQFQKVKKAGILFGEEFLGLLLQINNIKEIQQYIQELDDIPLIDSIKEIQFPKKLYQRIINCIAPNGEVLDQASPSLRQIRRSLLSMETSMRKKIEQIKTSNKDYLSQETISTRDHHFVLPVKSGNKNKIKGIIHGMSSSGQTMFIEPDEMVQMNHQYLLLQEQEKQEIITIFTELTKLVQENLEILETNQEILIELDQIHAKANYAIEIDGVIPTIGNEAHLLLKKARHPLIDKTLVVPNDIELKAPETMLIISGTNTGGKTVVLKTVGLISMMALSGLCVPCSYAIIPFYDQIFVDLGDEQSIEQSLSTFSSHMKKIVAITSSITSDSLVLLDEIGSGTDPKEGGSLARAILDYLHDHHVMTLVSTHYSSLKQYAKQQDYVKVCAVEFDQENLKPTYRLIDGSVGNSYAIEISSRLGLDKDIVEEAYRIKASSMSESDRLLERLQDELAITLQKQDELENNMQRTNELKQEYETKLTKLKQNQDQLLQEAKNQANMLLDQAKEKIDQVVLELKQQANLKPHVITQAKYALDQTKYQSETPIEKEDHVYQLNDRVLVKSVNREGEIVDINKKGILTIQMGGLKINAKPEEVKYIGKKVKVKPVKSNSHAIKKTKTQSYEINVIGKRYEEAMLLVDKFLDDALLQGYSMVRIVHGMGTGVLRKGIREMLKRNKDVVSFRDGGPNEGGLGATLVYFE